MAVRVSGMTCALCECRISGALKKIEGIADARADYATETVRITYDESRVNITDIKDAIEKAGYNFKGELKNEELKSRGHIPFGILLIFFGILIIGYVYSTYGGTLERFTLEGNIALSVLFLFGLITGVHCIGMCGGFVIAYSSKSQNSRDWWLHIKYGAGKLLSNTIFGGVFGLLGSIISFTLEIRSAIGILAGIFLMIYGLNQLNIFPYFRKIHIPSFINLGRTQSKEPFVIGFANGLFLACGPLSAMYIFAAGTGSPVKGAISMFAFGLGTLPAMMIFGLSLSSLNKYVHGIMRLSGIFLIVLGFIMVNNGMTLFGSGINLKTTGSAQDSNVTEDLQVIRMSVDASGWSPDTFILKKGIKVRWIIDVKQLTNCNKEIIVKDYGLDIKLKTGENIVEFTPDKEGTIRWSCWMGMIPGTFTVV
ncbi:MAG: sulfite exporter TauE/SafE family protein [Candidatus Methanoperedens sp.]|nr:sulfite exporter TauE/SafE family protein [Candidatus Methanoperedens sp.]